MWLNKVRCDSVVEKKCGRKICVLVFCLIVSLELFCCKYSRMLDGRPVYGVFLSLGPSDMAKMAEYQTVVIDAQYFSKKDIAYLKAQGCTLYSYINIGSLENFRDYYNTYSELTLGNYENWEEEQWIDVSSAKWQKFLISIEKKLLDKGIDGFFVDNCDVYYEYPTEAIFEGITTILEHLMEYHKPVIINGGDTYIMRYQQFCGSLIHIMTGVNQETVWSKINFDTGRFSAQTKSERNYFQNYIEMCDSYGLDVYLLEYTTDNRLKQKIEKYCAKNKFQYYISDSIELD